ncbi:hypothetical protein HK16_16610 [Acetobacter senegalensis]|uniref:Uncharacterized protein n=3 Tax=Acetobacteraceae TaxID=433 RepID=A0A252EM27_9PROT|nr:hypothetical protein CIW82_09745 [Acetobacter tropicalis]OUL67459.1 hypothetical protein HK16_16610 [Acetobacter senegalensis]
MATAAAIGMGVTMASFVLFDNRPKRKVISYQWCEIVLMRLRGKREGGGQAWLVCDQASLKGSSIELEDGKAVEDCAARRSRPNGLICHEMAVRAGQAARQQASGNGLKKNKK